MENPLNVDEEFSNSELNSGSDDETEKICRVCRCPGEPDDPLCYPCLCAGSIKYIHSSCLLEWLKHCKSDSCELCKYKFKFSPIYKQNTPVTLGPIEIMFGIFKRSGLVAHKIFRAILVCVGWLLLVPFCTARIFKFFEAISVPFGYFPVTLNSENSEIWSNTIDKLLNISNTSLVSLGVDCALGYLIWIITIFVGMSFISVVEFLQNTAENARVEELQAQNNEEIRVNRLRQEQNQRQNNNNNNNDEDNDQNEGIPDLIGWFFQDWQEENDWTALVGLNGPIIRLFSKCAAIIFLIGNIICYFVYIPSVTGQAFSAVKENFATEKIDTESKNIENFEPLSFIGSIFTGYCIFGLFLAFWLYPIFRTQEEDQHQ